MLPRPSPAVLLAILCATSLFVATMQLAMATVDMWASDHTLDLWGVVFLLQLASWVDADTVRHRQIYRPYELGWFVYLFVIPYLPYYLIKTRGARGVLWLVGFIALYLLADIAYWIGSLAQ